MTAVPHLAAPARRERPASVPRPRVLLVGGPDVDARLPLMRKLSAFACLGAVGTSPTLGDAFRAEGFDYWPCRLGRGVSPLQDLRAAADLVRLFRCLRPALVHAFDTKPGIWGVFAARAAGVPAVVATVTGLGSLFGSGAPSVRLIRGAYCALQRAACSLSDRTVFQNTGDLGEFVGAGITPRGKEVLIPGSGVSTATFDPDLVSAAERRRLRDEVGLAGHQLVVTLVSRVIRSKGVLQFAEAAGRITGADVPVRFLLVGAPDEDSADRLTAQELAELRRVLIWPGPRRDVRTVLAISDVFVLPSSYREGVPRVLLEAASMALPLVTTPTPGCADVVRDGANGYLVPAHDIAGLCRAIRRLLRQPELRRRFGAASRKRAIELFDLSAVAASYWTLYRGLLDERGAPAGACGSAEGHA